METTKYIRRITSHANTTLRKIGNHLVNPLGKRSDQKPKILDKKKGL